MRAAVRAYAKPEGGANVPGWRPEIIGHPFMLDPVTLDFPRAVRFVGIVRACVMRKAEDIASLPLVVERAKKGGGWEAVEREDGNVLDVLAKGNHRQSGLEVFRDAEAHYLTSGNSYIVAETFGGRLVQELWTLPSQLVEPVPGERRSTSTYVFLRGGRRVEVKAEFVIHRRDFNPDDDPIGMSRLQSVTLQYETRYDLARLIQKIVRNGGVAAGYYRVPLMPNGAPVSMAEPDKARLKAEIKSQHGIKNADAPKILNMVEFERMGLSMQELQFLELCSASDADVARAVGMPPWMVGIKEGGKLAGEAGNGGVDERLYWQNARTEVGFRDAQLSEQLMPLFEKGLRLRTDMSHIVALNKPIVDVAQGLVALVGRPILSLNEGRGIIGQSKRDEPEADELHLPPPPTFGAAPGEKPNAPAEPKDPEKPVAKQEARSLEDEEVRTERWRGVDALMVRHQRKVHDGYRDLYRAVRSRILASLESSARQATGAGQGYRASFHRAIDIDAMFTPSPEDRDRIEAIYKALLKARGAEAFAEIALELELNLAAQTVRDFLARRVTLGLEGTLATTFQSARLSLAEGVGLAEGLSELAARMDKVFDDFEQGRLLTIARTETVSAFNFASTEAYAQSGEVEGMEWLSARDTAVRTSHAEADGQVAMLGAEFRVGDSLLQFPGDPAGAPEETINCRCTVLPVLTERTRARRWKGFFRNGTRNRIAELVS